MQLTELWCSTWFYSSSFLSLLLVFQLGVIPAHRYIIGGFSFIVHSYLYLYIREMNVTSNIYLSYQDGLLKNGIFLKLIELFEISPCSNMIIQWFWNVTGQMLVIIEIIECCYIFRNKKPCVNIVVCFFWKQKNYYRYFF